MCLRFRARPHELSELPPELGIRVAPKDLPERLRKEHPVHLQQCSCCLVSGGLRNVGEGGKCIAKEQVGHTFRMRHYVGHSRRGGSGPCHQHE